MKKGDPVVTKDGVGTVERVFDKFLLVWIEHGKRYRGLRSYDYSEVKKV